VIPDFGEQSGSANIKSHHRRSDTDDYQLCNDSRASFGFQAYTDSITGPDGSRPSARRGINVKLGTPDVYVQVDGASLGLIVHRRSQWQSFKLRASWPTAATDTLVGVPV